VGTLWARESVTIFAGVARLPKGRTGAATSTHVQGLGTHVWSNVRVLIMYRDCCAKSNYTRSLLVLLLLTIAIRLPFAWIPYQAGDIGTFLLHGMSIVKNGAVYGSDFYNGRAPGGFYIYASLLKLFGCETTFWINLLGAFWHATLTLLVVCIAKRLWNRRVALYAGFLYSIFSFAHMLTDSLALNVETMALLPLLISVYFFLWCHESKQDGSLRLLPGKLALVKLLVSGLFLGLTFSIRQSMAAALPVFCIVQFMTAQRDNYESSFFLRGLGRTLFMVFAFAIGLSVCYIHPLITGKLYPAIYCSVIFGFQHPVVSWPTRFVSFCSRYLVFVLYQPLLWVGVSLAFMRSVRDVHAMKVRSLLDPAVFMWAVFLVNAFGVFVMGRVAGHCFFALFPFAVLILAHEFSAYWFPSRIEVDRLWIRWLLLFVGCVVPLVHFLLFPAGVIVKGYTISDYLAEMLDENTAPFCAAQYIKDNTSLENRIYCLTGSHANDRFYFMAQRLPATVPLEVDFRMDVEEYLKKAGADALIVTFSPSLGGIQEVGGQDVRSFLIEHDYNLLRRFDGQEHTKFYYGKTFERRPEWVEIWHMSSIVSWDG